MHKAMLLKLGGFVAAVCATGALVAVTVPATGAYFSDAKAGSLAASSGHLTLNVTDTSLDFSGLMPGENRTKTIDYAVDVSSGAVDVWLVFDKNGAEYQRFTGGKGSPNWFDGGLGRYGYFQVGDSHGGTAFVSGNLAFPDRTNTYDASKECAIDATGRGGSNVVATSTTDYPPYCGVPAAIKLAGNLPTGTHGTIGLTFGLNGVLQTQQNQDEGTVHFQIVATQAGHAPA